MKRTFVSQRDCPVNAARRLRTALALSKEAFWVFVSLSSLGLWAAVWAGAGSLASAWLQ